MAEYKFARFLTFALGAVSYVFAPVRYALDVAFPRPEPSLLLDRPDVATPRTLGLSQVRAYAVRAFERRSEANARAPLAGSFVTA